MKDLEDTMLKDYHLAERIGSGGFGAVYRATQTTINREVAVKIILPGYANKPDFIRRFEIEAQLIARLEHPHITPLIDFWRDTDGTYLVMRYLRGGSIRQSLTHETYGLVTISQMLDQLASALAFAHRHQVIHRDIKPGNILLDEDGNAYLADFGIAKDLTSLRDNPTAADAMIGSLDYISPEQARSEPVTPRTDIYSLGVTLYEMITGEHPFKEASSVERLYKHINDPLPEITNLPDEVYDEINTIIQTATAKDPQKRYPDVMALAVAFREGVGRDSSAQNERIIEQLTMRQHEILGMIADGLTNAQIAEELFISISTVRWHINHLYKVLGVRNRVQAIVRGRELDLIVIGNSTDDLEPSQNTSASILLPEPENPYKGLHAFQMTDARDFFGRDELVKKLIDKMCDDDPYHRFIAIVGPSGSGKSSLVKAGLIPKLWIGELKGSEKWFVVDMIPGTHPLDTLETALIRVAANQTSQLREQLQRDERGLLRVADIILPRDDTELLIVVDQFEEVFTLVGSEDERQHFLNLLRVAVNDVRSRVRIVVTLRADYYDRPLHYPEFGELLRTRMETVLPLSVKGLERAVRGPAERVGVTFEQGLTELIVSQMNYQAGALPLLQYALTELFDRRKGRLLTHDAYQEIGGAGGALANRADEIYRGLTQAEQELARQMFMRLVTLGEGAEDTRRRATNAELLSLTYNTDLMEEIIDQFAAYRLLSLDHDAGTRQPTLEVAHEAILREWDRLRQWLNESRDDIRQERAVSRAAEDWNQHDRDASYLLRGTRLEQVEKWKQATKLIQTPLEQEFIASSLQQRDKEQQAEVIRKDREKAQEKRSQTLLSALVVVFAVAAIIAGGLALFALNARNAQAQARVDAEQSADEFRSVALSNAAIQAIDAHHPDVALALALEAVNMDSPPFAAEQALFEVTSSTWIRQRFKGHSARVSGVTYSPDEQTVVTAGWDGQVILWDVETGEILKTYQHPDLGSRFLTVAFHPDGHMVAISGLDIGIILWDLETNETTWPVMGEGLHLLKNFSSNGQWLVFTAGTIVQILEIETGEILQEFDDSTTLVSEPDISRDGRLIVAGSLSPVIYIWDTETGELLQTLEHPHNPNVWVQSTIFTANGTQIVSGDTDGIIYLWDWQSGEIIRTFEGHESSVFDIAISPDELYIASGDNTGLVRLWALETGEPIRNYYGHTARVADLQFNSDGNRVLTASLDGTAILWDVSGEGFRYSMPQIPFGGSDLAISPTGEHFALVHSDGVIRVRDIATGDEVQAFGEHQFRVRTLAYTPNGRYIISGYARNATIEEPAAYIWDAETGELLHSLEDATTGFGVSFSPDSRIAAFSELDPPRITLWDTETWQRLHVLEGHLDWVIATAFGPDGSILYSGSIDQTIRMWNTQTGEYLGILVDEATDFTMDITEDGKRLLIANSQWAGIVDTETGVRLVTISAYANEEIQTVEFSPNERYVLVGTQTLLILWDIELDRPSWTLVNDPLNDPVSVVQGRFTPDGQTVVSKSFDDITVWEIPPLLPAYQIWVRANRYIPDFTCDQRELYQIEPLCEMNE